jgi:hypothetical protein
VTTSARSDVAAKSEPVDITDAHSPVRARRRLHFGSRASLPVALLFPLGLVLLVLVLGGLKLSGSSASLYAGPESGPVAGRARNLRTDEWWVRTPLVVRQVQLGLPDRDQLGVGGHDMGVVSDLPTRGLGGVLFRPHTAPYHVLGIERAFALEWWTMFLALPALGLYALGLAIGMRVLTAALISMLVVLSPFVQWWTGSWTGTSIGYSCLAGAALIAATRARSLYARIALGVAAGWLAACFVIVLYPPTIIPMTLVVGAAVLAVIARSLPPREQRSVWWLRLGVILLIACVTAGVIIGAFYLAHRGALAALAGTVYPGRRRSSGGAPEIATLFGAPFDLVESTRSAVLVAVNGLNQSEASAGLFAVFAVAAAVFADPARFLKQRWRNRGVLLAILAASAVVLAWYLFAIPQGVGRILLFDRVRPERTLLTLAVASALALGVFVDAQRRTGVRPSGRSIAAGTAAFAVPTVWAGLRLEVDGVLAPRWQVMLLAAAFTAGVALALRGSRLGLWLLVGLFAVSAAMVNPLQGGLTPLVESPSAQLGRELRARPGTGAVLNFWGGDLPARGGLTASGVDLVSGVNLYPNRTAWRILDPHDSQRQAWDRYSNAVWSFGPSGSKPQIDGHEDTVHVTVDPCDPRLAKLGVRTIVSIEPLAYPCLLETDRRPGENGKTLYAYRIDRG